MFQIIGAMSEFERALIQERVCAGLHHAPAKGKVLGRPRTRVDLNRFKTLRAAGCSWRTISGKLGVAVSVAFKAYKGSAAATKPHVLDEASLSEGRNASSL
jgi:DNA invertase Pin-like site-specific DNA recombinase